MTNDELDALCERLGKRLTHQPDWLARDALAAIKALRAERDEAVAKLGTDVWGLRTMWRDAVNRAEAAEARAEKAESVLSAIEKWFSTTGHSCSSTTVSGRPLPPEDEEIENLIRDAGCINDTSELFAAIKALREQVLHENECYKTEYGLRIGTIQLLVEARFERDVALMERRGLEAERDEAVKALEELDRLMGFDEPWTACGCFDEPDGIQDAMTHARAVLSRLKEPKT
jgi:hypothetical protein